MLPAFERNSCYLPKTQVRVLVVPAGIGFADSDVLTVLLQCDGCLGVL